MSSGLFSFSFYCQQKLIYANSVDPDQKLHSAALAFDLGLHCFKVPKVGGRHKGFNQVPYQHIKQNTQDYHINRFIKISATMTSKLKLPFRVMSGNTNTFHIVASCSRSEPPHDKTNTMTVHPAKTQISLGICPV